MFEPFEKAPRKMGQTTCALFRIADLATSNLDSHAIHEVLLRNVSQVVQQDFATMVGMDGDGLCVTGVSGAEPLGGRIGKELPDPYSGLVARALAGKRMMTGTRGDGLPSVIEYVFGETVATWAIVPIIAAGKPLGALILGRKSGAPFAFSDEKVLRPMAAVIARLLETRLLYEDMRDHSRHLAEEHRRVVEAHRLQREFISNVSHELRTPLTGIMGYAELLQDDDIGGDPETRNEYLKTIHGSGQSLLTLINQILDFGKMQAGQREPEFEAADLGEIARTVVENLRATAVKKGLEVEVWTEDGAPAVWADPIFCAELLTNLVGNAIKFTDSGWVRVVLRKVDARSRTAESVEAIECRVVDTGPGVPFAEQQAVFEPFRQLEGSERRRHGGTGLGLALCRDMVEAMDGRIWVESGEGEGASFVFIVPSEAAGRPRSDRGGEIRTRTGRVLGERTSTARSLTVAVREGLDGPLVAVCLSGSGQTDEVANVLRATGYRVETTETGADLLSLVQRRVPRAVITDMHLPDLNGWQVLGVLRSSIATRQVGVLLASPVAAASGQAIRDGYGGCVELQSPLDPDRLLTWVSMLTEIDESPPARVVLLGFDGEFMAGLSREAAGSVAAYRCDSAADAVKELRRQTPALLAWRPSELDPTEHCLVRALADMGPSAPRVVIVTDELPESLASLNDLPTCAFKSVVQASPEALVRRIKRLRAKVEDPSLPGDPLTGLPGRDYLDRRLAEEQHRADRYGRPFSVLTFTIHPGGPDSGIPSAVQRAAASAIRGALRICDVIGRAGPGVFVALLPETTRSEALGAKRRLVELFPSGEVFGYAYSCHCWSRETAAKGSPEQQLQRMFSETA